MCFPVHPRPPAPFNCRGISPNPSSDGKCHAGSLKGLCVGPQNEQGERWTRDPNRKGVRQGRGTQTPELLAPGNGWEMHRLRERSRAVETERPKRRTGRKQKFLRCRSSCKLKAGTPAAWKSRRAPAAAEGRGTNKSGAELGPGVHACRANLRCLQEHLRNTEEVKMARRRIGPSSRF